MKTIDDLIAEGKRYEDIKDEINPRRAKKRKRLLAKGDELNYNDVIWLINDGVSDREIKRLFTKKLKPEIKKAFRDNKSAVHTKLTDKDKDNIRSLYREGASPIQIAESVNLSIYRVQTFIYNQVAHGFLNKRERKINKRNRN